MNLKPTQKSQASAIYKCSVCGNLHAMLRGEVAPACEICHERERSQRWIQTKKELLIATRNVRKEIEKNKTFADKVSDRVTDFCGNVYFVYVHIVWFGAWVIYNLVATEPFDPYPFGMLTLVVSLEAILLATFILMSQNREAEIAELRAKLDYETDLRSEKRVAEILALLKKIYQESSESKK